MKKLLIVSVLMLGACTEINGTKQSNIFRFTNQGAGFSPYTANEWRARAARGEPGLSNASPFFVENDGRR
ncbi:MAG: hypothetical protein AAGA12_14280 [Pseudomonadota bacterium]